VLKTLTSDKVEIEYKALIIEISVLVVCNVLMNAYWASLIIAQVKRVLSRGFSTDNVQVGGLGDKADQSKETEMQKNPILNQDA